MAEPERMPAGSKCEACHTISGSGRIEYIKVRTTNGALTLCRQCLDDINRKNPELLAVTGVIQRFQPPGSPPPGGLVQLAEWVLATLREAAASAAASAPAEPLRKLLAECRPCVNFVRNEYQGERMEAGYIDLLARIDAALAAPPVSAWRDISEAPKDGTEILLFGDQEPHEMINKDGRIGMVFSGYWDRIDRSWCSSGSTCEGPFYEATHWQPLPAPPTPQ